MDEEKEKAYSLMLGLKINTTIMEISSEIPGHIPRELPTLPSDICTSMLIAALFNMTRKWDQHRCLLTDEWDNENLVHIKMEYFLEFSTNEKWNHKTDGPTMYSMQGHPIFGSKNQNHVLPHSDPCL